MQYQVSKTRDLRPKQQEGLHEIEDLMGSMELGLEMSGGRNDTACILLKEGALGQRD